jgi:hypothetical protein
MDARGKTADFPGTPFRLEIPGQEPLYLQRLTDVGPTIRALHPGAKGRRCYDLNNLGVCPAAQDQALPAGRANDHDYGGDDWQPVDES